MNSLMVGRALISLLASWRLYRNRQRALRAPPRLVATMVRRIRWQEGEVDICEESITFYLRIDGRGRRSWRVHEWGYCKLYRSHEEFLGPIIAWAAGGSLPDLAVLVRQEPGKLVAVK